MSVKDPCPTCKKPLLRDAMGFIVVAGANPDKCCPDPRGHEALTRPELGFKLEDHAPDRVYRVLACDNCGNDTNFEITLADNGQWGVECLACGEAAVLFSDLINNLR